MTLSMDGLQLTPPEDFLAEEVSASWRTKAPASDLQDPRSMNPQLPVRPNLIAQRRTVPADSNVGTLVSKVCADLARHVEGVSTIDTSEFTFDDGTEGLLIKYTIPAFKGFQLAQMQAARLDGDIFTTLTLSTELTRLNEETLTGYLASLASATVQ